MEKTYGKAGMLTILLLIVAPFIKAQSTVPQPIKNKLNQINKSLDSAEYLGFDVQINYWSDTVSGKYESDSKLANYTLHKGNMYVNVGGMEYMQNDSISITAYNNEKMMMATTQRVKRSSSMFPLQNFSDSILNYIGNYYTITDNIIDSSIGVITFESDSAGIPYQLFSIQYTTRYYLPLQIDIRFIQPLNGEDAKPTDSTTAQDSTGMPRLPTNKYMQLKFKNYSMVAQAELFDPMRYIFFDRQRKAYMPSDKYAGYKLYASTLNYTQKEFDDIEVPVAPLQTAPN